MADYFNSRPATSEERTYVTINGTDMRTYGLELTDYRIGAPVPVTSYIDVPGRNGRLDISDALGGYISYSHREIELHFHIRKNYAEWHNLISVLSTAFDGVESKIVFSKDPDWYYKGRFEIDFFKSNPISGDVVMSCRNCDPFKMQLHEGVCGFPGRSGQTFQPNKGWAYMSEIELVLETIDDGAYIRFNSNMQGDDTYVYGAKTANLTTVGKKKYIYYGTTEVRMANYLYLHSSINPTTAAGTWKYRFEAGVF